MRDFIQGKTIIKANDPSKPPEVNEAGPNLSNVRTEHIAASQTNSKCNEPSENNHNNAFHRPVKSTNPYNKKSGLKQSTIHNNQANQTTSQQVTDAAKTLNSIEPKPWFSNHTIQNQHARSIGVMNPIQSPCLDSVAVNALNTNTIVTIQNQHSWSIEAMNPIKSSTCDSVAVNALNTNTTITIQHQHARSIEVINPIKSSSCDSVAVAAAAANASNTNTAMAMQNQHTRSIQSSSYDSVAVKALNSNTTRDMSASIGPLVTTNRVPDSLPPHQENNMTMSTHNAVNKLHSYSNPYRKNNTTTFNNSTVGIQPNLNAPNSIFNRPSSQFIMRPTDNESNVQVDNPFTKAARAVSTVNTSVSSYQAGPVPLDKEKAKTWIFPKSDLYLERKYQVDICQTGKGHIEKKKKSSCYSQR